MVHFEISLSSKNDHICNNLFTEGKLSMTHFAQMIGQFLYTMCFRYSCLANQTEEKNECVALTGCSVMNCDPGICVPQSDGTGECYNVQPELLSAKAALAPAALGIIIACLILMLCK